MERQSDKHSARQDDELKQDLEGRLRSTHLTRSHEGIDSEPPADDDPVAAEGPVPPLDGEVDPEELRLELSRYLTRSGFPADREQLTEQLRGSHAPDPLVEAVGQLPADRTFRHIQDVVNELVERMP